MSLAVDAVRRSHDRFAGLVTPLAEDQLRRPSYASEWTIADVASHLGSQAEIFGGFLDAGIGGTDLPGRETFGPIWDRWNAKSPSEQVTDSVAAGEEFTRRLEQLDADGTPFRVALFGAEQDLDGMAVFRLREHAAHTWDIAVALEPTATIAPDAVRLLLDILPDLVVRAGQPVAGAEPVTMAITDPDRALRIRLDPQVQVEALSGTEATEGSQGADVRLEGEALLRLVYGRLDPAHTPQSVADARGRLADLRRAFPGF